MGCGNSSEASATSSQMSHDEYVPLHGRCGTTSDGVVAFSNASDSTWTSIKHYEDGFFMGYQWQCVEFARRWLWLTKRLILPTKLCAYCFSNLKHVQRPIFAEKDADHDGVTPALPSPSSSSSSPYNIERVLRYEQVPCRYVKQGSSSPPKPASLIIYPFRPHSPWGHIGVIVNVDVLSQPPMVYVADQNRSFTSWGDRPYSFAFPLEKLKDKYYIRDHQHYECSGWIEFD